MFLEEKYQNKVNQIIQNQLIKGSDRQSEVVELSMQYCAQIN